MKILVTGINGLVGNALDRLLSETNHNTLKTSRTLDGIAQEKLDITSVSELDKIFDDFKENQLSAHPNLLWVNCIYEVMHEQVGDKRHSRLHPVS